MSDIRYIFKCLLERKIFLAFLCFIFAVFIILGVFLPKEQEVFFYSDNTVNIFIVSLAPYGNPLKLIVNRLFADLFCLTVFFVTSFMGIALLPVNFLIIAYKGYVAGAIFSALLQNFGFTGIMLYVFVVFVQVAISFISLTIMTVMPIVLKARKRACCGIDATKVYLFCAILIVLSVIVQILFIVLFLRPSAFSFSLNNRDYLAQNIFSR